MGLASLFRILVSLATLVLSIYIAWHVNEHGLESSQQVLQECLNLFLGFIGLHPVISNINSGEKVFTKEELSQHKGEYLAIVGEVFDVRKGERHYGKEGGYQFFTGIDGTRAFASGEFNDEGLIEDITGLEGAMILSIEEFREMYHADYTYIGKLQGHYYDGTGKPTKNRQQYAKLLGEAHLAKSNEKADLTLFPPCNSESKQGYRRVWCSTKSGGISRDWVGVPRRYYKPGSKDYRCACVRTSGAPGITSKSHKNRGDLDNPSFKLYDSCQPLAASCTL